ncbi:hypothetical protein B0H14DRAFT_3908259 [Mycena olivaceomarginata]|nr:hypothetical protein B0H14DRAFT_3908259 [Mycena olivaceomarginata]
MTLQYPPHLPRLNSHAPLPSEDVEMEDLTGARIMASTQTAVAPPAPNAAYGGWQNPPSYTTQLRAILLYAFTSILDIFTCVVPRNFRPTITFFTANRRLTIVTTDAHAVQLFYIHPPRPCFAKYRFPRTNNTTFPNIVECPGITVAWPLDLDVKCNETFPFHRLSIGRAVGRTTSYAPCCHECDRLPRRFESLADIATHAEKGTNYKFLHHAQMKDLLIERTKENNDLKLASLNTSRQLATFARKMGDYERLIVAIATNDVPRVNTLINTALRNGASVNTITSQIIEAVQGLRSTKGFTEFERDLSLLIYRIGGNSLLYSMNHALGLPSLRTITNSAHFVKITPTLGPISAEELRTNIQKVILEPHAAANKTKKSGVVIMMDEVAIEEHADYFPAQNKVGGLCQKHSGSIPLTLNTYKSALTIVDALRDGKVHFAKEMLVVAAKFPDDPNVHPILVAPTCKQETAKDMTDLFKIVMSVWEEVAEPSCGDIDNFASDGDGLRRKVGYKLLCTEELPAGHPLHKILSNMRGLNLCTGPRLILMTFDWRHEIKRDSTLVRQESGMCVDAGEVVNPVFLGRSLQLLPQHDEKSVHKLLNPDDPQDVPRAIDLIEALISLRDAKAPHEDIALASTLDSVWLLGHVFENFAIPFITPNLSLSNQVTMLSTYAHLAFVLFREYRLSFMSNQLYGDTQSTVKNIRVSSPSLEMAGGHNSAMNYKQGVERSGWACDIAGLYGRWRALHRESRRRRVTRTEHKDHLNAASWNGDLKTANCDLIDCWAMGEIEAIRIFREHSKLAPEKYDIRAILDSKEGIDFLRPWGDNIYPGVADDVDRSIIQPKKTSPPSPPPPPPPPPTGGILNSTTAADVSGGESEPEEEESESEAEEEVDPEPISFQDLLEEVEPTLNLTAGPGIRPQDYLADHDGKPIHKASICRLVLNKEFVAKSKDRTDRAAGLGLGRIRCFTKPESRPLKRGGAGSMTGSAFIIGDLFLTLIQHGKKVSLAVCKSTALVHDGSRVTEIGAGTIGNAQANVKLTGQILHLQSVPTTTDDTDTADDPTETSPLEGSLTWLWLGTFLTGTSKMKDTDILTTKPITLTVPGIMVELVNPTVIDAHGRLPAECVKGINSSGTTWAFHDAALRVLVVKLSLRLNDGSNLRALPNVKQVSPAFPYKNSSGEVSLVSDESTALISEKSARGCLYCPEIPKNWRAHMGGHILRRLRNSGEPEPKRKGRADAQALAVTYPRVGDSFPCGFCGRSGHAECQVFMKAAGKKNEIQTKCPYAVKFQYKTADEGSAKGSCRNVPLICGLCPAAQKKHDWVPAVWRYNMAQHLRVQHSEYASPQQPEGMPLPFAVWESMEVSPEEERALGVKDFLIAPRFAQVAPAVATEPSEGGSLKRSAAQSGGPKGSKRRATG